MYIERWRYKMRIDAWTIQKDFLLSSFVFLHILEFYPFIYLYSRRKSFVNILSTISCCNNQVVCAFCLTIQQPFSINGSIRNDFKIIIIAWGYAVFNSTVVAFKRNNKKIIRRREIWIKEWMEKKIYI